MSRISEIQKRGIERVINLSDERTVFLADDSFFTCLIHQGLQETLEMTQASFMPSHRYAIQTTEERLGGATVTPRTRLWLANSVSSPTKADAKKLEVLEVMEFGGWVVFECMEIV